MEVKAEQLYKKYETSGRDKGTLELMYKEVLEEAPTMEEALHRQVSLVNIIVDGVNESVGKRLNDIESQLLQKDSESKLFDLLHALNVLQSYEYHLNQSPTFADVHNRRFRIASTLETLHLKIKGMISND